MTKLHVHSREWSIKRAGVSGRRSGDGSTFPREFLTAESRVDAEFVARPLMSVRRAAPAALDFSYDLGEGEAAILAIRHPSGALTFHPAAETARAGAHGAGQARFVVTVHSTAVDGARRGPVRRVIKAVVIKIARPLDKGVALVVTKVAEAFERASWKRRGLKEGWVKVTADALAHGTLTRGAPSSTDRSLLLLHGTFSHAAAAFRPLGPSTFFDRVAPLYGDRIFAFNHFSLSRSLDDNARMLLAALPERPFTFDVITHSRGGLVLRTLVERAATFGTAANRFKIGRAVLVASPNDGTPLATPARWHDVVGWLANLLEIFPDNPFTIGAEFVAHALVWLARHLSGDLPGLHAMDGAGAVIGDLQAAPGPAADAYSALVANYNPTGAVLRRLLDTGIDHFFGAANDLVVPSEGGWRIDHAGAVFIPGARIGCFGPGGNLPGEGVTHVSFFSQPETVDFLVNSLSGQPQPLPAVDPAKPLPDRRLLRSAGTVAVAAINPPPQLSQSTVSGGAAPPPDEEGAAVAADTFHLMIMPRAEGASAQSQILAHYGSARVLEDFHLGGTDTDAGSRWATIIRHNEAIKNYVDRNQGQMPTEAQLREFGELLFETLFPGAIRRLYDTARSLQRAERLNVILTSTIPWVADKPWEFAYDPVRKTSLATEDIHFVRNVMTGVPAEIIDDRQRLRILVASSQPIGLGRLSIDEEEAVIRRGFEPLREAGLADVEVLARATPASLHAYVSTGRFSIVHVIGHGEYDESADRGYLVFQDDQGNPYRLDERSVRQILCGRGIRLVFLNACETGVGGRVDFNSGVAPALVAGGVPIVVANQYKVLDFSATFFSQHFYWRLAQGVPVAEAAREARVAVHYSLTGDSIDFAVPVVYARDPCSRLSPPRAVDFHTMPSPVVRASGRRSVARHKVRVAVWDTHSQFPALRATVAKINAAQAFYGFEIVDLSVPIDAWHVEDHVKYLDANRLARRLAPQISQLGVHYIAAIVDDALACELETDRATLNVGSWWPSTELPPVLIFSSKGFGVPPKGPRTDRVITNAIVRGIAGYLSERNPRTRPLRDGLIGLRRSRPDETEALRAILAAFD